MQQSPTSDRTCSCLAPLRGRLHPIGRVAVGAVLCALASVAVPAHEGHEGVAPTFRQVQVGTELWRVGLGVVPADPFVGDELRIEVKAESVPSEAGAPSRQAGPDELSLRADATLLQLRPTNTEGVLSASWAVESAGAIRLSVELRDGAGTVATAEFPVRARPAAAGWLKPLVLVIILLLLASPGLFLSRDVRRSWDRGSVVRRALLVGSAAAVVLAMLPVSGAIATALGTAFTPERPAEAVDWIMEAPAGGPHLAEAAPAPAEATAPGSGEVDPSQIVARVMAPPDREAQVVVPMPGRVFPAEKGQVTVGSRVTKGQTLVRLQPSYIMHDALHLINLRWPILQNVVATRRRMVETEVEFERLKAALKSESVGESQVRAAETAATAARQEYGQWSRTLAMHDTQIKDDQPKNLELSSPISGEIALANFSQGQLVYEGQSLFTVVDLTTVWVEVRVPEQVSWRFRRETIEFSAPSSPGMTFTGRLHQVAPAVDPQSRTLSFFYLVENPRRVLRIGMLLSLDRTPPVDEADTRSVRVLGRVAAKPELQAQVSAPIWGRVEFNDKPVFVGQTVKKGDPLARLILELSADERYLMEARKVEIAAAASLADTRLQQAERDYRRAVAVLKADPTNPVRRAQAVGAERVRKSAEEEKTLFDRQVGVFEIVVQRRDPRITVVEAPIAGTISALSVKPGDRNQTGEFRNLAEITDLARVWIEAEVFERDVVRLVDGVHASFTTDDGVTRELGRPVAILPWVDAQTRTVKAVFEVPNPDRRLRLGMTVHVSLDPVTTAAGE